MIPVGKRSRLSPRTEGSTSRVPITCRLAAVSCSSRGCRENASQSRRLPGSGAGRSRHLKRRRGCPGPLNEPGSVGPPQPYCSAGLSSAGASGGGRRRGGGGGLRGRPSSFQNMSLLFRLLPKVNGGADSGNSGQNWWRGQR